MLGGRQSPATTVVIVLCGVSASHALMIVGWDWATGYLGRIGSELYREPFLYYVPWTRRGVVPLTLAWLPYVAAIAAASLPRIVLIVLDWRRKQLSGQNPRGRPN
jgi:hypothetical protein